MPKPFEAVRLTDRVYWVGAIDWAMRDFHGYSTRRGSTYNAYLVMADEPVLIDTVRAPFRDEFMSRIASVVDPRSIRTVISNHSEMDHSGLLPRVVGEISPREVIASAMGAKTLADHFHDLPPVTAVKDGETRAIGNVSFTFFETKMLHWPDSMISYLAEERVLFSQDAFGMHLAAAERFDDEIDPCVLAEEAKRYYANIIMPYSPIVLRALEKLAGLALPATLVAPDHGPVWRRGFPGIVESYRRWAEQKPTTKAVVAYDTMWNSTALMARAISEGLTAGGASPILVPLRSSDRSDLATEVLGAGALLVGTPTLNGQMFPTVADALAYLTGLRPANLVGAAFGSHGCGGEGALLVKEGLERMKVESVADPLRVRYVPRENDLAACRALGAAVAARLHRT